MIINLIAATVARNVDDRVSLRASARVTIVLAVFVHHSKYAQVTLLVLDSLQVDIVQPTDDERFALLFVDLHQTDVWAARVLGLAAHGQKVGVIRVVRLEPCIEHTIYIQATISNCRGATPHEWITFDR